MSADPFQCSGQTITSFAKKWQFYFLISESGSCCCCCVILVARTSKTSLTRSDYGERNKIRRKRGQEAENKCLLSYMPFSLKSLGILGKWLLRALPTWKFCYSLSLSRRTIGASTYKFVPFSTYSIIIQWWGHVLRYNVRDLGEFRGGYTFFCLKAPGEASHRLWCLSQVLKGNLPNQWGRMAMGECFEPFKYMWQVNGSEAYLLQGGCLYIFLGLGLSLFFFYCGNIYVIKNLPFKPLFFFRFF